MLQSIQRYASAFEQAGMEVTAPKVVQTLSEEELCALVPQFEGWIIGDDPATARVFEAGAAGRLRAAVKWGIGVDNVSFEGARAHKIKIINTPGMFGAEVADLAMHYVNGLAREAYYIDRMIRAGKWPKPAGRSLAGKTVALVGFGDIGRNFAKRAAAADMVVRVYDPAITSQEAAAPYQLASWPTGVEDSDFIVLTCALTATNRHMVNEQILRAAKRGAYLVNVARGPLVDEVALTAALKDGHLAGAALDVFEVEPVPATSELLQFNNVIFGSHNASNTLEGVDRASLKAIELLHGFLTDGVRAA